MTLYNPENPDSDNNYEPPSIIKFCNQDLIPLVLSHRVDQSTVPPIKIHLPPVFQELRVDGG